MSDELPIKIKYVVIWDDKTILETQANTSELNDSAKQSLRQIIYPGRYEIREDKLKRRLIVVDDNPMTNDYQPNDKNCFQVVGSIHSDLVGFFERNLVDQKLIFFGSNYRMLRASLDHCGLKHETKHELYEINTGSRLQPNHVLSYHQIELDQGIGYGGFSCNFFFSKLGDFICHGVWE